jgi:hypothetical protein
VVLGTFDYAGGTLTGYTRDPAVDEVDRKEFLRKNRRIPVEQTVAELGEGRGMHNILDIHYVPALTITGIYGPGYEERRRERIKERYGIDVSAAPSAH